jgi:membrane fusion protein, copper/silver efflux system
LIYSPELITAQKELLEAIKLKDSYPAILTASREKLKQWKLTDTQITDIESAGIVKEEFDMKSNTTGIVITKRVNIGDYVSQGSPIYEICDLTHVWALFEAYENDLPWLKIGDSISFTIESLPGRIFKGNISFIDPVINTETRIARVRVEVVNVNGIFKPGMFVTGNSSSFFAEGKKRIVIPQSAVLWTGTRSIVYVKVQHVDETAFIIREITLGPSVANGYLVLEGLTEGEEIVTNGTYSVDASAQLAGKKSMMNLNEILK